MSLWPAAKRPKYKKWMLATACVSACVLFDTTILAFLIYVVTSMNYVNDNSLCFRKNRIIKNATLNYLFHCRNLNWTSSLQQLMIRFLNINQCSFNYLTDLFSEQIHVPVYLYSRLGSFLASIILVTDSLWNGFGMICRSVEKTHWNEKKTFYMKYNPTSPE